MANRPHVRGGSPEEEAALAGLLLIPSHWEDESNMDRFAVTYREMCQKAGPPPLIKQES